MTRLGKAVRILHSPKFGAHVTPKYHPESPFRTDVRIVEELSKKLKDKGEFHEVQWLHPKIKDGSALLHAHTADYLQEIAKPVGFDELRALDADTYQSAGSYNVSRLASSAWLTGMEHVLKEGGSAFALSRPPGHHSSPSTACGFCTINHAVVCAGHALFSEDNAQVQRVAMLDIDVHFGNGIAAALGSDPKWENKARYCSLHQQPAFPFSGGKNAESIFAKYGSANNLLRFLPMLPGIDGRIWLKTLKEKALPFLHEFNPDLLIISAGFDALDSDPLASLELTPDDFRQAAIQIRETFPDLPIIAGLEGGYDVDRLPEAIAAFL
eukprot:CAMPEP_0197318578 /NCGR_PEP_ID=MMETSP0891-20130614/51660_1 /TAXON_ID=44058 ORGANISM="Aureoumbra lagunensis, Strain CCMP1510" /NCGR_SAMPLE_ID=MMETSP0891 /ASSEMBLY_ACC=CAM_ASM_000534 /LENGTH=324 /DNA_ID=CAMNT_0042809119 /DNA_START=1 /DNA_END=972 /DNA_ORIENTATION=+